MLIIVISSPNIAPCDKCLADPPAPRKAGSAPVCDFDEGAIWEALGGGWRCLYGCYCQSGISVEWHDFSCERARDWSRSFHPDSLEVCLNFSGLARITREPESVLLGPMSAAMYFAGDRKLSAWRFPGERHQFLTVEYSIGFLERHLVGLGAALHQVARRALLREGGSAQVAAPMPMGSALRKLAESLKRPPLVGPALGLWYQGKAMELIAELFFLPSGGAPEANSRRRQLAQERVERAIEVLKYRLAEPPSLEELGREVGCSPFYLSRTFSKEMNMTIPQYLRQLRMERAAELLKSSKFNVTEAALEVGYSSLSHFSQAFCEVMGCCPGLYPLGLVRSAGHKPLPLVETPTPRLGIPVDRTVAKRAPKSEA